MMALAARVDPLYDGPQRIRQRTGDGAITDEQKVRDAFRSFRPDTGQLA